MVRALLLLIALLAAAVAVAEAHDGSCSGASGGPCPSYDTDGDGVRNEPPYPPGPDNCPTIKNADQDDSDGDGVGDACSDDDDGDGVPDAQDNCRVIHNPGQNAEDCPARDSDGDGVRDEDDNCPRNHNPDQMDLDEDRRGDVCDADDDTDGVPDYMDNCPRAENAGQEDADGNGVGSACDVNEIRGTPPGDPAPTTGMGAGTAPGSGTGTGAAAEADRTAPTLRVAAVRTWTAGDLRGRAPLQIRCSEACGITARLTLRGRLVATGEALLGGSGRTFVFFSPRRGAITRVARMRTRARAVLTVRVVDEAGNRRTAKRRVWLRR